MLAYVWTCVFRDLRLVLNVFLYPSSTLFTKVGSLSPPDFTVDTAPVASQPASAKA